MKQKRTCNIKQAYKHRKYMREFRMFDEKYINHFLENEFIRKMIMAVVVYMIHLS